MGGKVRGTKKKGAYARASEDTVAINTSFFYSISDKLIVQHNSKRLNLYDSLAV